MDESIIPIPTLKMNAYNIGTQNKRALGLGITPENGMIITIATSENSEFTSENRHFSSGKIYFGTYTFFTSAPELTTDVKAPDVESTT
jgi:hypothetical protein